MELPQKKVWLRPFSDAVHGTTTPDGKPSLSKIGEKEGIMASQVEQEILLKSKGFYHAFRFHCGAEYTHVFGNKENLVVSADLQLHQDGQTKHQINGYDPSNPWEYEFTFDLGWELENAVSGRNITIFAEYHDGRISILVFLLSKG